MVLGPCLFNIPVHITSLREAALAVLLAKAEMFIFRGYDVLVDHLCTTKRYLGSEVFMLLQAVLGEGAQTVLEGQRVLPGRTQEQGFSFQYSTVNAALKNIYKGT